MELNDLKNSWDDISNTVNKQQHLNSQIIDDMTKNKYHSKLNKIAYPEILGTIICLAGALYIGLNFGKLDTLFLQITAIITLLLLLVLPAMSILALRRLNTAVSLDRPYAETLKDFAVQKIRFYKFQKLNIVLSYLLLVTTIILLSKFFNNKDITNSKYFWTCSITTGYIFLLFFSKWVLKSYKNSLRQAEDLLKELAA